MEPEDHPPYATALEAYRSIHECLSHFVKTCLEDGDEVGAMESAAKMIEIEKIIGSLLQES